MAPKQAATKFLTNDRVLCYHGTMLYEAKVLDVAIDDGIPKYFVHYQGWNNRWDEWVLDDRLLEPTDENLKKQQDLAKNTTPSGGKGGGSGGRRGTAGAGEQTPNSSSTSKLKIIITGGKSKSGQSTGSSGPSTPFDDSKATSIAGGDSAGPGLEIESRASTPSVDGGASVTSSTTSHATMSQSRSGKRKSLGKPKTGGGNISAAEANSFDTSASGEPKRKRARPSAQSSMLPPPGGAVGSSNVNPESGVESLDQFRGRQEVKIKIPEVLLDVLINDWDLIMRQSKLCKIPASKTVDDILDAYLNHKLSEKGMSPLKETHAKEFLNGLRLYFNSMLGNQLLYKFERPQYNEFLSQQNNATDSKRSVKSDAQPISNVQFSSSFGLPHLMRLCVRMGQMLAYTDFEQKAIDTAVASMEHFLKYLSDHKAEFFRMEDYETATPEYQRRAYAN